MNQTAGNGSGKVLLINANRCATPEPVFPLGLAHLNSALRQAGHEVIWLDLLFEGDRLEEVLSANKPDLVGISVRNIDDVLVSKQQSFVEGFEQLVERIHRQAGCPVVLGGSGFSILPRELLEMSGADFGIVGEGENSLLRLLESILLNDSAADFDKNIPGLAFRQDGVIQINQAISQSHGARLARSDWPPQITDYYLRTGGVLNLQTQRGCAHRCCYCTYPVVEGTRHRRRSPEDVAAELEQIQSLGGQYVFIVDSIFNSSERHVTEICEAILRRNVNVRWGCFLRPRGLNPKMMKLMARAGLTHIEFGSDSFCDAVLEAYQKDLFFEDIRYSSELARNEGIDFCHFVIAGGPGETRETLEQSYRNSKQLGEAIIMAVPGMRIYPGTRLFEVALAEGQVQVDAQLLKPVYYIAPGFTLDSLLAQLKGFAALSPNWIIGDFDPAYEGLVARLRKRGVTGPLWSYFAAAQRLRPSALLAGHVEADQTS